MTNQRFKDLLLGIDLGKEWFLQPVVFISRGEGSVLKAYVYPLLLCISFSVKY